MRGPINSPKDGIAPLERLVDAAIVPATLAIQWRCMRPNHTIRFAAGEPFGTILPYLPTGLEDAILDIVPLDDESGLELYEQTVRQLTDSVAVQRVFQRLGAAPADSAPLVGIVFSRDRAMQLDTALRSFFMHCHDADEITLYVIYKTSDRRHAEQYAHLAQVYEADGRVHFVEEIDFRQHVMDILTARGPNGLAEHVVLLVDDTIFVRAAEHVVLLVDHTIFVKGFRLAEIRHALSTHPEALGFSFSDKASCCLHANSPTTQRGWWHNSKGVWNRYGHKAVMKPGTDHR